MSEYNNNETIDIAEDRELDWDDVISADEREYSPLPEGDYTFTVEKVERGRSKGSEKLPPCNMALVSVKVRDTNGRALTITDSLVLHSKCKWRLHGFFVSIGLCKQEEEIRMNWTAAVGREGICHVIIDKWKGNDGTEKQSNKISKYLAPKDSTDSTAAPNPTATTGGGYWG